jgi:hypothetical protein
MMKACVGLIKLRKNEVDATESWGVLASHVERLFRVLQGMCFVPEVWKNSDGASKHASSHYKTVAVSGVGSGLHRRNTPTINEWASVCAGSY